MAKSMKTFRGKDAKRRKQEAVQKVRDYRAVAQDVRTQWERRWNEDEKDLAGRVDKNNQLWTDSQLRPGFAKHQSTQWRVNVTGILTADDHLVEVGASSSNMPEESIEANQSILDHFFRLARAEVKINQFVDTVVSYGSGVMKVVRHMGRRKRLVREPIVDPDDASRATGTQIVEKEVAWPYYGPGIENIRLTDFWRPPVDVPIEESPYAIERKRLTRRQIEDRWPHTKEIPEKAPRHEPAWANFPTSQQAVDAEFSTSHTRDLPRVRTGRVGEPDKKQLYDIYIMYDAEEDEIIVELGDAYLLDYSHMWTADKRVPFVMGFFQGCNGAPYARSLTSDMRALNSATEFIFNSHIDAVQQTLDPKLVISQAANIDIDEVRQSHAGALIHTVMSDARAAIAPLSEPIPSHMAALSEVQLMGQWQQLHSGVSNFTSGSAAGSGFNRTATGIVTLTQRQQNIFTQFADKLMSEAINPLGDMVLDTAHLMIDRPEVLEIVGRQGEKWQREITYDDLTSNVKAYPKRMRDHSERAQEANLWLQLLNTPFAQSPEVDRTEVLRRLLRALGERNPERLVPGLSKIFASLRSPVPTAQSMNEATKEQRALLNSDRTGSPSVPPPQPDMDDTAHLHFHEIFKDSEVYSTLSEEAQTRLEEHMLTHNNFAVQAENDEEAFLRAQSSPASEPASSAVGAGEIGAQRAQEYMQRTQSSAQAPEGPPTEQVRTGGVQQNVLRRQQ